MPTRCACLDRVMPSMVSLFTSPCSLPKASRRHASGQIVHRDVKGLNVLLKEMRGYFETCICDFGAQSNSNSPGQRRGRRRTCRQALRESRTSLIPCQRRASREPRPSCRPNSSRCRLDTARHVASAVAKCRMQDLRVTLKSDVFSFAITMWEMASRMHPWHGLGVMAVCAFPPVQGCPRMACGGRVQYALKPSVDDAL
jgi:serine/threonine protein kinase